jgi:hypothetical protein
MRCELEKCGAFLHFAACIRIMASPHLLHIFLQCKFAVHISARSFFGLHLRHVQVCKTMSEAHCVTFVLVGTKVWMSVIELFLVLHCILNASMRH